MVINIMLSVNQAECDRTSERIKAVFDYKRSKGNCVTGMCAPYGYIIENGYIHTATRSVVEDAIQHYFPAFPFVTRRGISLTNTAKTPPAITRLIKYSITPNTRELTRMVLPALNPI